MIERSRVRIPAGAAGEFYSPGSTFCFDAHVRSPETITCDIFVKHVITMNHRRNKVFTSQTIDVFVNQVFLTVNYRGPLHLTELHRRNNSVGRLGGILSLFMTCLQVNSPR